MIITKKSDYSAILVGSITFAIIAFVSHLQATAFNNYVVLADAFLHGHLWFNGPNPFVDALVYGGKYYVIEAPLPAILLLPLVALQGLSANQTFLATILAGVALGAAWEIGRRLDVPLSPRIFTCIFLLLGTDLFWCATDGSVWLIAHVSAVAFTLLAILELLGKRRSWLVAIYAVCAAQSRFSLMAALPVYAALLVSDPDVRSRGQRLIVFGATLVPFVCLWVAYNEARWHLPYDIGYSAFYRQGGPLGSPFGLKYLGYELSSFLLDPPLFSHTYPYVIPTIYGIALTWTSPALIIAFRAHEPRRWTVALWAATLLTALPNLLYFANGYSQFGMRHALDFEPFLFVLMLLAVQKAMPSLEKALCAYSTLVGIWGVWFWRTFSPH
jgi:hypothetical protein